MRACPFQIRAQCYTTLVRPILVRPCMGPSPTKGHQLPRNGPEKVGQIRLPELQPREQRNPDAALSTVGSSRGAKSPSRAMLYKSEHSLVAIPVANYLRVMPATTRGHDMRYLIAYCRTTTIRHSFFPDAARLWNKLPSSSVMAPSTEAYKTSLQGRTLL